MFCLFYILGVIRNYLCIHAIVMFNSVCPNLVISLGWGRKWLGTKMAIWRHFADFKDGPNIGSRSPNDYCQTFFNYKTFPVE